MADTSPINNETSPSQRPTTPPTTPTHPSLVRMRSSNKLWDACPSPQIPLDDEHNALITLTDSFLPDDTASVMQHIANHFEYTLAASR